MIKEFNSFEDMLKDKDFQESHNMDSVLDTLRIELDRKECERYLSE